MDTILYQITFIITFAFIALLAIFVISGGITGAGLIGKIKFFMLYIIMVLIAAVSLYKGGVLQQILSHLPQDANMLSFIDYA